MDSTADLLTLAKSGDSNMMNSPFGMILGIAALRMLEPNNGECMAKQSDIFASQTATTQQINDTNLGLTQTITTQAQNTNGIINTGFTAVGNGQDRINSNIRNVGDVLAGGQTSLGNRIDEANYQNLIQFKDLDNKLCGMENRLSAQATANQYATNENFKNLELRDMSMKLDEVSRERDLLATGNFPVSTPVHLDRWQGTCPNSGIEIDQNAINIAIGNGIAQGISQLAPILGK